MEETPAAGPIRRDGKSWERGKRKERPQSVVDCGSWVEERRQLPERRGRREKSFRYGDGRGWEWGRPLENNGDWSSRERESHVSC
jgi:hypothetical protein